MPRKVLGTFDFTSAPTVNGTTTWFPSPTGTNASGTWGISITGTAGSATNIAGGTTNQIPYQTGSGATSFYSGANYGVMTYTATGVPSSVAGAAGVLQGSASVIPTFTTTPTLTGTNFSGIPNGALTNSSLTIGSTTVALGSTTTTFAGLTSVTSTTFVGSLTGSATQLGGVAAASYALLAGPTFTGVPTAPTAAGGTSTTQIATTAFVRTPSVQSITSSATPTLAAGNDLLNITALAAAPTFAAPTGTWLNGQSFMIQIDGVATVRALAWNAIFQGIGGALPTTTVSNKTMVLTGYYSSSLNKFLVFPAMNQP